MVERDVDPLAALAQAWRAVAPPREDAELAELDAETRRAVARLRAAWDRVEAPAGAAQSALRRVRPAPWRVRTERARSPWAAAAALLLALGGAAGLGYRRGLSARGGPGVAQRAPASTLPFGAGAGVGVERATSDRIELRAGNVRLVLLTGGAPGAHSALEDERMDR